MQLEIFKPITRTERQRLAEKAWVNNKGIGTLELPTGFGKTRCATDIIQALVTKSNLIKVIIVVPQLNLKDQWNGIINSLGLNNNCEVIVINTAIKHEYKCDLLVIDEAHRAAAEQLYCIFDTIQYKFLLCLTATMERLDERHTLVTSKAPIVDKITILEALANGWVSEYKEYQVLIDVDDIEDFKKLNSEFQKYFEFFNYDFNLAMSCLGPKGWVNQLKLRDERLPNGTKEQKSELLKQIKLCSAQFMRIIQARKKFINNHPKKLEIARKIIEARPNSKIITFSNNIKMAESIGYGTVYSGKDTKKKGRATIEDFKTGNFKVLNTIKKVDEGADIPGVSIAIMLGIDSSKIKARQRLGRVIRKEDNKIAEIFNIIINGTQECEWFKKSHSDSTYITIDEEGLDAVLRGEEPKPYKKKITNFVFRF